MATNQQVPAWGSMNFKTIRKKSMTQFFRKIVDGTQKTDIRLGLLEPTDLEVPPGFWEGKIINHQFEGCDLEHYEVGDTLRLLEYAYSCDEHTSRKVATGQETICYIKKVEAEAIHVQCPHCNALERVRLLNNDEHFCDACQQEVAMNEWDYTILKITPEYVLRRYDFNVFQFWTKEQVETHGLVILHLAPKKGK